MSFPFSDGTSPPHSVNDDDRRKERGMMELDGLVGREMEEPSWMDECRVMERRQEIARIEQMGKVGVISLQ